MKSRKIVFTLFLSAALIIFLYAAVSVNFLISDSYTIIEGSRIEASLPPGIYPSEDTSLPVGTGGVLSGGEVKSKNAERRVTLKVFNLIPVKEVSVNTVQSPVVYPSGECIGVKIYSRGIIVTGFTDFDTSEGLCVSPGAVAGLKSGDIITAINGVATTSISEFTGIADSSGECVLDVTRGEKSFRLKVNPKPCTDGHMRMGIYVKNSIAGVGTMTFSTKDEGRFAALGHGISDSDTGVLLPIQRGTLYKADIIDIRKGTRGNPGEIIGALSDDNLMGECTSNTNGGIYGVLYDNTPKDRAMTVAPKGEVKEGKATLICTVDESGEPLEYTVEILSVNRLSQNKTKSFSIKVTDEKLLKKTGGIVQGMSGSPILQNGRIVGAVTHVFVNDPTRGYGIFIENMLAEAKKSK
ncbi:MAG: SpoIVB peptidase [Clostridia bacterium]|nr:SpoIVB peptidase [Clostridia bacterium]